MGKTRHGSGAKKRYKRNIAAAASLSVPSEIDSGDTRHDRCVASGKICFSSSEAATEYVRKDYMTKRMHSYFCTDCGAWHVSTNHKG